MIHDPCHGVYPQRDIIDWSQQPSFLFIAKQIPQTLMVVDSSINYGTCVVKLLQCHVGKLNVLSR